MSSNWVNNLDMLAQNGVLDFDAASFVMGQTPRYVGKPMMPPSPYVGKVPPAKVFNQPEIDEFKKQKNELPKQDKKDGSFIHNPSWKKWAFGALALGGIVLVGFNAKTIAKWTKNLFTGKKFKTPKWSSIKDFCSDKWEVFKNFCSKCWNKLKGFIKKPKP